MSRGLAQPRPEAERRFERVRATDLVERYAAVLIDAYGVLVDGAGAIEGAPEFVRHLNASGAEYLILTNDASKHPERGAARYRGFGLELDPARIITSGSLLTAHFAAHDLAGAKTLVLGPEDSVAYAQAAGADVVPLSALDAEVVIICDEAGFDFLETLDHVLSVVLRRVGRSDPIHLVLPNPDLIYPKRPGEFGIAAGSIAKLFEDAIALRFPSRAPVTFHRLGKPYAAIFEAALARTGTRDMVMIGDQLATDIRGARDFGIAAGLVTWGLTDAVPLDLDPRGQPTHLVTGF